MDENYHKIQLGDVTLNVLDTGQGEPVLLVHGFPDCHDVWRKQIPALVEAGFRVIAPDTRGCGESSIPRGRKSYRLQHLVGDLINLLDALDIDQVQLVAHDWGAIIGWHLTLQQPERVKRYLAMSVGHPSAYARGSVEQKLKGWYVLFFQFPLLAEWLLRLNNWWLFRTVVGFNQEFPACQSRLKRPGRLTAGLNYYRANISLLFSRSLPKVSVPVTGLWSDRDRFLAESQMRSSARYCDQGFRYEKIEVANHWLQLSAPAEVNRVLLDFLIAQTKT